MGGTSKRAYWDSSCPFGATRAVAFVILALAAALPARAITSYKQQGFSEKVIFSGLVAPTTMRFLPDGRILVAEKSGLIKMFDSVADPTPTIVVDLRTQAHNFWDRGLLGLAVDPNFVTNNAIYVAY